MSTIDKALRDGVLDQYALPDWEGRHPLRPLYVAPELFEWADATAALVDPARKRGGRLLIEHLEEFFCDMKCSERPGGGDLRRVNPTRDLVWKLHPPGLRIYGWFCQPKVFVAIAGALEADTKEDRGVGGLNDRKRDHVKAFAAKHGLTNTMLKGDHRAVIHAQG